MPSNVDTSLSVIVTEGDRRRSLEALRDRLAKEIDDPELPPRELATVAKELRAIISELDSLPIGREESKVDDLAERRTRRRAEAAAAQRP